MEAIVSKILIHFYQFLRCIFVFYFSVNRVKNDTGVIINISESDNNSNIIRIEGRKDGVESAKSVR